MKATIEHPSADSWELHVMVNEELGYVVPFHTLNDLIQMAMDQSVFFTDPRSRAYVVGFTIGAMATELHEAPLDCTIIQEGICETTDRAWAAPLTELSETIKDAVIQLEGL